MPHEYQTNQAETETAIIVGAELRSQIPSLLSINESLDELTKLAETAGIQVVGRLTQSVNQIDPATFIGKGKVEEIKALVEETDAHMVIFDDELSPRHQRGLEKHLGEMVRVIDRSVLILDIFAQHAQTREGALQIELAQYEYRLPRLTRQWTHLARQAGGGGARGGSAGVGLRGPGETQLEVDKREIGRKITHLKRDIEDIRRHRSLHREQRRKSGIPVVALVGYTNAGKSTLLNALSGANIYAADQLFATLDPTTRRVNLESNRSVLFTDTVGFIQKLPTTLIAAFRATLEEITEADIILHVVDASHPNVLAQIQSVEQTLKEINTPEVPKILVWNKMDKSNEWEELVTPPDSDYYENAVFVSAKRGEGLADLLESIQQALSLKITQVQLLIPYEEGGQLPTLFNHAQVIKQEHRSDGVWIDVLLSKQLYDQYKHYQIEA